MIDEPLSPTLRRLLRLCRMDRTWVRGAGCWLWDETGRRFLDFYAQFGAAALGHNPPVVVAAVQDALARGVPALAQPYRAADAERLAAELTRRAPGNMRRCVFTTSGAHAVEAALKLVRAATGRPLVLAAEGSFHGKTLGALALTGQRQYAEGFGPLPGGIEHVPFGDADALAARLARDGANVAAFFVEPIQGERGVIVPPAGYLRRVRELCTRHGVALVFDEVQTGLGRTGRLFACDHDDVAPDVLLLAKALGGGLFPLGACLASADFWCERFELRHSATFANNNLACRAGLAVLEALTDGGLCDAAAQRGEHLQARLRRLARRFPSVVADVRGRGLLCALELRPFDAEHGYFLSFLHNQGLYAYAVAGALAEAASVLVLPTLGAAPVLRLAPPLVIERAQIDAAMDGLEEFFARLTCKPAEAILQALGVFDEGRTFAPVGAEPLVLPPPLAVAPPQPGRYAFIVHYTRPEDVPLTNPCLAHRTPRELRRFCDFLGEIPPGVLLAAPPVVSLTGARAEGHLLTVPLLPEQMAARGLRRMSDAIRRAVDLAASLGASVVGLGAYTTPFSRRGGAVVGRGPAITTGSALTAAMALEAAVEGAQQRGRVLRDCAIAVVGAGGSVGRLCARLLARERPRRLVLVGNPRRGPAPLRRLAAELGAEAATLDALAGCDVIVSASGDVRPVLDDAPLSPGAFVCDVARPPDASERLRRRPDITVVEGGLVALPDPTLRFGVGNLLGLPDGVQLACFAETILMALEGLSADQGIGDDVPLDEVERMRAAARRHGFRMAPWAAAMALVPEVAVVDLGPARPGSANRG